MSFMSKDNGKSSPPKKSSSWKRSKLEVKAEKILRKNGLDWFEEEHRFCERRWRFDIAFVKEKIALEIEGGIWKGKFGGHTSGKGYTNNCEKYNEATVAGWKVLRVVDQQIDNGDMLRWIKGLLGIAETKGDPDPS